MPKRNHELLLIYETAESAKTNQVFMATTLLSVEDYSKEHPEQHILHAFYKKTDLIQIQHDDYYNYIRCCTNYGLHPADFGRKLIAPNSDILEIVGIKPRNRIYKIRIYNHTAQCSMKCTPEYIQGAIKHTAELEAEKGERPC